MGIFLPSGSNTVAFVTRSYLFSNVLHHSISIAVTFQIALRATDLTQTPDPSPPEMKSQILSPESRKPGLNTSSCCCQTMCLRVFFSFLRMLWITMQCCDVFISILSCIRKGTTLAVSDYSDAKLTSQMLDLYSRSFFTSQQIRVSACCKGFPLLFSQQ